MRRGVKRENNEPAAGSAAPKRPRGTAAASTGATQREGSVSEDGNPTEPPTPAPTQVSLPADPITALAAVAAGDSDSASEQASDDDQEDKNPVLLVAEMRAIEAEYESLKEAFFTKRIAALDAEIALVKSGDEEIFKKELKLLEETQKQRITSAERWRRYQLATINNAFDAERGLAAGDYITNRELLRERMLNLLLERQRRTEEEIKRIEEELASAEGLTAKIPTRTAAAQRSLRKRGEPEKGKSEARHVPHIHYTLKPADIASDLNELK